MWLVAGLGNPGRKYSLTRHNVGFMAVDFYLNSIGNPPEKKEHKCLTHSFTIEGEKVLMAKPQTFMNHSGQAVQALCHYYRIDSDHLIVLHDEIEYPFKQIKIQRGRGHGGHNGIRDIHEKLNTNDYYRIRIGVGRPVVSKTKSGHFVSPFSGGDHFGDHLNVDLGLPVKEVKDHVLSPFSKKEQKELPDILEKISDGIEGLIFNGLEKTANLLNRKME